MSLLNLYHGHYSPEGIATFAGAGAIVAAARAAHLFARAKDTMRWQPVSGKITWSVVDEQMIRQGRYGERLMYRPDIRYSYTIGTHEHEGTRVYIGSEAWRTTDKEARGVVDAYPPGKALKVYVNPKDVTQTVLTRGQDSLAHRVTMAAIVCAAASIVFYLFRAQLRPYV